MPPGLNLLYTYQTAFRIFILSIVVLFLLSPAVKAQDIVKPLPTRLSVNFNKAKPNPYHAFNFPLSRSIDFTNYPLTADQILRRESQIKGYNRMYNMITNKNKNGFIGNFLGLQRIQKTHADPRF